MLCAMDALRWKVASTDLKQRVFVFCEFGEEIGVGVFQFVERAKGKGGAVGDQIAWA